MIHLADVITSGDPALRNRSLDGLCRDLDLSQLLAECRQLEEFRRRSGNLYERVRALFHLFAIHRFHLPERPGLPARGRIPFDGVQRLLERRYEEAIERFLEARADGVPSEAVASALAEAYHGLAFQTLADQVRRSVRSVRGNRWMFRMGHPADHPLRIRPQLHEARDGTFPLLCESTPVRMDLSHSAWSDIFFLGMDFPSGARVLNLSIDLAVLGRDDHPAPPIECSLRLIEEPVLRLTSVDLGASADLRQVDEVFDFARDHLGLLKAGLIASGLVPPGLEGCGADMDEMLRVLVGPGRGLELVTRVNDIPKGSRLAVSTNLLGSIIAVCMRATGQTAALEGPLQEHERRLVAARAILGEWIGGSGGGWQDSGGIWPGIKLIEGVEATEGDPEYGVSRGCLLPRHRIFGPDEASPELRRRLQESLVLVHGGMAQNVGPVLEMVTEKYLLRSEQEWRARHEAIALLDDIVAAVKAGDVRAIGEATTRNFFGPLQTIIPWATNAFTEQVVEAVRERFGEDFWGFWMLGGMSGGGMGFIFEPSRKAQAQEELARILRDTKRACERALPFAMEPVVYDFAINEVGSTARLQPAPQALLSPHYYGLITPSLLRTEPRDLPPSRRRELARFGEACRSQPEFQERVPDLLARLFPGAEEGAGDRRRLETLLDELGFDHEQHERIRADLRGGRIGLAQNRLPGNTTIEDAEQGDVVDARGGLGGADRKKGASAMAEGRVAVLTLSAGAASRWTQGAGIVKALNPFCRLGGRHRSFFDVHRAKARRRGRECGTPLPHVFTTSVFTHTPLQEQLLRTPPRPGDGPVVLSPGKSVGLRLIPTERDLRFAWEELPQQRLDEQAQKMRESLHAALIAWAKQCGEASDYTDNLPTQCLHPVGHWYEIPNMMLGGQLADLLEARPSLDVLMLHNVDTLGADVDPALLGRFLDGGADLAFEVVPRRLEDQGGGLARVDGKLRLVEGLALPREEDEYRLSYYNSMTTWIRIDRLLAAFGLQRSDLRDTARVREAVRGLAARMPTYITHKEVKKRWGHGQEDVFPVAQFERLWGDMSGLRELRCEFFAVARARGQQLKDPAQLDPWVRDGSAAYVEGLCDWGEAPA